MEDYIDGRLLMYWSCPFCKTENASDIRIGSLAVSVNNSAVVWEGQCPNCFETVSVSS